MDDGLEIYILDSFLRRVQVIDVFQSLIWTDRKRDLGDFQLVLNTSVKDKRRFIPGVRLAMNKSMRVMTVETVEDHTDSQGVSTLTISGRSFETILDSRLARGAMTDLVTEPKWILTGTPGDIARQIFHDICVTGTLDVGDILPYMNEGSILPADTIPEPADTITFEIEPATVYAAIKTLCDQYNMGFRILRNYDMSQLYFDIYMGSDRTSSQTDLPAVIFSPDLDNLQNVSELTSIALYKNVAYVFSPVGFIVVYPLDVDPDIAGFERQVLFVKADDITDTDPDVAIDKMTQRGLQELSKARRISAFDGEMNQRSQYQEGVDYYLGDLVEQRNSTGATDQMEITELIYVHDKEGVRIYPTLSLYTFIAPGTWAAQPIGLVWEDVDDSIHWADEPA